jgi:hypothetical protein
VCWWVEVLEVMCEVGCVWGGVNMLDSSTSGRAYVLDCLRSDHRLVLMLRTSSSAVAGTSKWLGCYRQIKPLRGAGWTTKGENRVRLVF